MCTNRTYATYKLNGTLIFFMYIYDPKFPFEIESTRWKRNGRELRRCDAATLQSFDGSEYVKASRSEGIGKNDYSNALARTKSAPKQFVLSMHVDVA